MTIKVVNHIYQPEPRESHQALCDQCGQVVAACLTKEDAERLGARHVRDRHGKQGGDLV